MKDVNGELLTFLQRNEIEKGLQDQMSEEEMRLFSSHEFNYLQMGVIRSALASGLPADQVRSIAKPWISASEMEELVQELQKGETPEIPNKKIRIPFSWILAVLLILSGSGMVWMLAQEESDLVLELTSDEIRLACGMTFDPSAYVKDWQGENARLILPDEFTASVPEVRLVRYELQSSEGTLSRLMRVIIVDETPPQITLSSEHIELLRVTPFACHAYLIKAVDNVDGDLSAQVECSDLLGEAETQQVEYLVKDSSGNTGTGVLEVHFADLLEPQESASAAVAAVPAPQAKPLPTPAPVPSETPAPYVPEASSTETYAYTETVTESQEIVSSETVVEHSFS